MPVYPGDPEVKILKCKSINDDCFNLFQVSMSNHTGTHIDFPAHVLENGKTSNDYPLSFFSGKGVVLDLSDCKSKQVNSSFFKQTKINKKVEIRKNDILLLKYGNQHHEKEFYPALTREVALYLIQQGIKIIGTESMSIDGIESDELPIHKEFLSNDVLVLEGLDMQLIKPGRVNVFIFPLKLNSLDGLPCRVGLTYE